jgi:metabotropic X receptor
MRERMVFVLALVIASQLALSDAQTTPVLKIPVFTDDTYISGPAGALLASYIVEVVNRQQRYPFGVELDVHFVYTSGPEAFYEANKVTNTTRPAALMGPEYSSPVQLISTVGDVYKVPIMAYWATSPYLSSKDEYPSVWRAVSSDSIRVGSWIDLCKDYQWAHAVIIEEASLYGRGASEYFEIRAGENGIRTWRLKLNSFTDLPSIMAKIRELRVKIVIAPLASTILKVAESAVKENMIGPTSGYVWVFGDAVSDLLPHFHNEYFGSLTVMEPNDALLAEFNKTEYSDLLDVAYSKVVASYDRVDVVNNPFRIGTPERVPIESAKPLMWTAGTLPSALVRGLLALCEAASDFFNANQRLPDSSEMAATLYTLSKVLLGENVTFAPNQEVTATTIGLVNMRANDPFHVFATWTPGEGIKMKPGDSIIWPDGTSKIPDDGIALEAFYKSSSAFGVIVILLSTLLCVALLVTLGFTIKFFNTPVFRLASPYSLITILIGLFIITLGGNFYLSRPSDALCQLRIWTYYVGLTMAYSALAAKTWRVWMVFRESNSLKKGVVITNMRLMIYTGLLTIPAILLTILRTAISDDYDQRVLSSDKSRVDVICRSKHPWWSYIQQGYAGLQMLATCFLAWKTRKVPTGFNEAKHVFISVYIVCTIGIIGLISSAAMQSSQPMLSNVFFIFSMLIVAGVMWGALFLPKLYIALLRSDLNTPDLMRQKEFQPDDFDDDLPGDSQHSLIELDQHSST